MSRNPSMAKITIFISIFTAVKAVEDEDYSERFLTREID
jgi:hypothetical protein